MEIHRLKNVEAYFSWPMVADDVPADFKTGLTVAVTAYRKTGAGAWASFTPANAIAEISTLGIYILTLSAGEMNYDQIILKFAVTGAQDTAILISTIPVTANVTLVSGVAEDISTETKQDVIDSIVDDILADTNELQTNQGNWLTATGFSTHSALDVWHVLESAIVTASTIGAKLKKFVFSVTGQVDSNVKGIEDDATTPTLLNKSISATEVGVVGAGAHTASLVFASDLTGLTADALKFGVINFTSGGNKGRSCPVTAYDAGTGKLTLDPTYLLPAVPVNGDTFTVT